MSPAPQQAESVARRRYTPKMVRAWWIAVGVLAVGGCTHHAPASDDQSSTVEKTAVPEGGTERPKKLVFGFTPYLPEAELRTEFTPLVEYIGRQVHLPTELRFVKSYDALIQLLSTYQVHVAQLSPFNYVWAKRENPDLILLATQIADGSSTYSSYIITRDDSGINSIADLKGKRFGFVDRKSTSGYLYPLAYLRKLGYEPNTLFGSVVFAGNHARLVDMVINHQLDAGATYSTAYRMAGIQHPDVRLKILAKTGRIPYDAYAASPRLDRHLIAAIRTALLSLSTRTDEGRRILGGMSNINGFVAVGDDHYDAVRRMARLVEQDRAASSRSTLP